MKLRAVRPASMRHNRRPRPRFDRHPPIVDDGDGEDFETVKQRVWNE